MSKEKKESKNVSRALHACVVTMATDLGHSTCKRITCWILTEKIFPSLVFHTETYHHHEDYNLVWPILTDCYFFFNFVFALCELLHTFICELICVGGVNGISFGLYYGMRLLQGQRDEFARISSAEVQQVRLSCVPKVEGENMKGVNIFFLIYCHNIQILRTLNKFLFF